MNRQIRLIVTLDQLDYLAERARVQLHTVPKRNGDFDLIIEEDDNVQVDRTQPGRRQEHLDQN